MLLSVAKKLLITVMLCLLVNTSYLCAATNEQVQLQSPLSTVWTIAPDLPVDAVAIKAQIIVPDDAPADLGCGAFIADRDLYWYQRIHPQRLQPGLNHVHFRINEWSAWSAEPGCDTLNASRLRECTRAGLFFFSAAENRATLLAQGTLEQTKQTASGMDCTLDQLEIDGWQEDHISWSCGERWQLQFQPRVTPVNPYAPDIYRCDLLVSTADGRESYPGFYLQPMRLMDCGSHEEARTDGPGHFAIRWRPRRPGTYQLQLQINAADQQHTIELPPAIISGTASDPFIKRDSRDARFFSTGDGHFYWPVGQTIASITGSRASSRYNTKTTPERGSFAYRSYFERFARAGVNYMEIWMSTWNASLEWSPDRPHYYGLGRYNQFHAARLEQMLDDAWQRKIRLVLNLRNHGQLINPKAGESEWLDNPYNMKNGGPCKTSNDFFDDPAAWKYQQALRRYIIARYADHPGVMCWKLFSEIDLTDLGIQAIRRKMGDITPLIRWHQQTCDEWHAWDHYDHPVATHFATDMHNADPRLCRVAAIDCILLDAYHNPGRRRWQPPAMGDLMADSLYHQRFGCARYGKPVFVTEYGGALHDHNKNKLLVEHQTGRWQALVSGHAAAPMLWWHEWVDQLDHFHALRAIRNFVAGEDLRGANARSVQLQASSDRGPLWCRAWVKPGCVLAYAQDLEWARKWGTAPILNTVSIQIGNNISAGNLELEWWDAMQGEVISKLKIKHPGGPLSLQGPACDGHIALKLKRVHQ